MKNFLVVLALVGFACLRASAQVTVELTTDQDQFIAGEAVPLAVKIINQSGQVLHLGTDSQWLTFNVESTQGFVVKQSDVPVQGPFDLVSSQAGTKLVDIEPYFELTRPGRYKVTAILHIKAWGATIVSQPKSFDVVTGAKIWSQQYGLPTTNGLPQMREFSLEKANYLREQLRLYLELSDLGEARIYKVVALGPMVSFGYPQEQIDTDSQLHVLWQTGGQSFSYCVVSPYGEIVKRDTYDIITTRPRLVVDDNGHVGVVGGVRHVTSNETPVIQPPAALPPTQ